MTEDRFAAFRKSAELTKSLANECVPEKQHKAVVTAFLKQFPTPQSFLDATAHLGNQQGEIA